MTTELMSERRPADDTMSPGRHCPLHYRYEPTVFAHAKPIECEVLYVVGGLYGNEAALDRVVELFEAERGIKRLVFNGDFHWFDADERTFRRVDDVVARFDALRGNVETELGAGAPMAGIDSGCGCAYPDWVGDDVVERSNRIINTLHVVARGAPHIRTRLARLPPWLLFAVAGFRVGVVHGDAESIAGWGFAQEKLRLPTHAQTVARWFAAASVDAFACTHTCLPAFVAFDAVLRGRTGHVLNNGSAGMPNFSDDPAGLLTRIAVHPYNGPGRRYGRVDSGIHLDAVAIDFDVERWRTQFDACWPDGSDAHESYGRRIERGPDYAQSDAMWTMKG